MKKIGGVEAVHGFEAPPSLAQKQYLLRHESNFEKDSSVLVI